MITGVSTQECSIWRPTSSSTPTAAGGYVEVWPSSASVPCVSILVRKLSPGRSVQLFGIDSDSRYHGWVDSGVDVQDGDVIYLTAGAMSDTYLLVEDATPHEGSDLMELELSDTDERPPV